MTTSEALEKMKSLQDENGEYETAHSEADKILCQVLTQLGFNELVSEFEKVPKWYS